MTICCPSGVTCVTLRQPSSRTKKKAATSPWRKTVVPFGHRRRRADCNTPSISASDNPPKMAQPAIRERSSRLRTVMPRPAMRSTAELLAQQLVDEGRVGLALGGLHDLADEEAEVLGVRGVLRDLGGVGGEGGVDGGFDGARVGDLAQALGLDDGGGVAAALDHF